MRAILHYLEGGEEQQVEITVPPGTTVETIKQQFYANLLFAPDKCEFIGAEIWRE